MAVFIGVQPGGRGAFAICALYCAGPLPAALFQARSYGGVDEALGHILGICNEWGGLQHLAIGAPLSWSGSPSGWRRCDRQLRRQLPDWAPASWLRAPNSLPGAISVQGPALLWRLAKEVREGNLGEHAAVETCPRIGLVHVLRERNEAVLGYRDRSQTVLQRRAHVQALVQRLTEPGVLRLERDVPTTPDQLDALVAALVALGLGIPDAGVVVQELEGGDIRPVGRRPLALLRALP